MDAVLERGRKPPERQRGQPPGPTVPEARLHLWGAGPRQEGMVAGPPRCGGGGETASRASTFHGVRNVLERGHRWAGVPPWRPNPARGRGFSVRCGQPGPRRDGS